MKTYEVILKNGLTYLIRAQNRQTAIKEVVGGKGRFVGRYFKAFKAIQASVQK